MGDQEGTEVAEAQAVTAEVVERAAVVVAAQAVETPEAMGDSEVTLDIMETARQANRVVKAETEARAESPRAVQFTASGT